MPVKIAFPKDPPLPYLCSPCQTVKYSFNEKSFSRNSFSEKSFSFAMPAIIRFIRFIRFPMNPLVIDSHPSIFNNAFNAFNFDGVRLFSNFSISLPAIASGRSVPDSGRWIFESISFSSIIKDITDPSEVISLLCITSLQLASFRITPLISSTCVKPCEELQAGSVPCCIGICITSGKSAPEYARDYHPFMLGFFLSLSALLTLRGSFIFAFLFLGVLVSFA